MLCTLNAWVERPAQVAVPDSRAFPVQVSAVQSVERVSKKQELGDRAQCGTAWARARKRPLAGRSRLSALPPRGADRPGGCRLPVGNRKDNVNWLGGLAGAFDLQMTALDWLASRWWR